LVIYRHKVLKRSKGSGGQAEDPVDIEAVYVALDDLHMLLDFAGLAS